MTVAKKVAKKHPIGGYFANVKVDDIVYGLIYGRGEVVSVNYNAYYIFEVVYKNNQVVPYTIDGVPSWGRFDIQTVYYKEDIDLMDMPIEPADNILGPDEIIKLRLDKKLLLKCPSGIWRAVSDVPADLVEEYLEKEKWFLFKPAS